MLYCTQGPAGGQVQEGDLARLCRLRPAQEHAQEEHWKCTILSPAWLLNKLHKMVAQNAVRTHVRGGHL